LLSDLNAGCNSVSDFFAVVRHNFPFISYLHKYMPYR
jgi:hypothetical protein